jgi:hypothetical protein
MWLSCKTVVMSQKCLKNVGFLVPSPWCFLRKCGFSGSITLVPSIDRSKNSRDPSIDQETKATGPIDPKIVVLQIHRSNEPSFGPPIDHRSTTKTTKTPLSQNTSPNINNHKIQSFSETPQIMVGSAP